MPSPVEHFVHHVPVGDAYTTGSPAVPIFREQHQHFIGSMLRGKLTPLLGGGKCCGYM
jgi:hypothetical protein